MFNDKKDRERGRERKREREKEIKRERKRERETHREREREREFTTAALRLPMVSHARRVMYSERFATKERDSL